MKINKKYESLIDEKVIEGSILVGSKSYSASINLIKTLDNNDNYPVIINTESKEVFNDTTNSIKIDCSNTEEALFIFVGVSNRGFGKSFQIKGYLQNITSEHPNKTPDNLIYYIPNSSAPPFVNFDIKWGNTIQLGNNHYEISYHLSNDYIQINVPEIQKTDYLLLRSNLDKKIRYLTTLLSFCRSTTVEWESCTEKSNEEEVGYRFIKVNTEKSFPNILNPFRSRPELWIKFIEHCVKGDMELQSLIDTGIFQACGNLRWGCYLDEMTLIRHVAALEGLCRIRGDKGKLATVVDDEKWKKFREYRKAPLKEAMLKADFTDDEIFVVQENIRLNSRILNGLPIKVQIGQAFKQNKLDKYYDLNKDSINDAFNVRNTIVHEGWNSHWKNTLFSHVFVIRNALFITIISMLDYDGELYFCDSDEPVSTIALTDKNMD